MTVIIMHRIARLTAAAAILLLVAGIRPAAAAADLSRTVHFDIAPQQLPAALLRYSEQSGVQVTSPAELVDGKASSGVMGSFPARRALERLLEGTDLGYDVIDASTVTIRAARRASVRSGAGAGSRETNTRIAQGTTASSTGDKQSGSATEQLQLEELEEIVVTGSRLGQPEISAQRVRVLDRDYIERSGFTTVSEIISTLPEASMQTPETDNFAGAGTVRLRGLPLGSTLVLLNGRSLGTSATQMQFGGFFDLNNIPAAAVERIEVLPSASSAIYGGEALAGVVNIILKQGRDGVGTAASYGAADGTNERQATVSLGHVWGKASLSILGTYFDRSALLGAEREITADQDYRRYGGLDLRREMSNPGNVYSTNGANLPGLGASFAALPAGNGILTPQDLQATAGTLNRSSSVTSFPALYPDTQRQSFLLMGEYQLTDDAELFSEVLYSSTERTTYAIPFSLNRVRVPAANPFNPFEQDVLVSYEFTDTPGSLFETEYIRPLVGARGQVTRAWNWEAAAWLTNEETDHAAWALNLPAVNAALASTDPAQAFNPFASGPGGAQRFAIPRDADYSAKASNVDAFLRGSILERTKLSITTVIGAEASRNTFDRTGVTPVTGDRDAYAFFSEVRMPVRAERSGVLEDVFTLSAAVRYDNYSDFGSVATPQIGFVWKPVRNLFVTASYGETFKPPTLFNLYQPLQSVQAPVFDPRRGNERVTVDLLRGGNTTLDPQTGEGWSVGLAFSPADSGSVQASLTYWDMMLRDSVGGGGTQVYVDHEAILPGRVIRASATPEDIAAGRPGRILTVDGTWMNVGTFRLSGVDASLSARFSTKTGVLRPSLSVSNIHRYDGAVAPFVAPTNRVGVHDETGFAPRWKGTASLAWERGPWSASLIGRYTGKYTAENNPMGNLWYLDSHLSCDLAPLLESMRSVSGLRFSVGVVNALDREPDFAGGTDGYDENQYDIRGRFWRAQVTVDW